MTTRAHGLRWGHRRLCHRLVVNSLEWFAPFQAEGLFADCADAQVRSYFRRPYRVIDRQLLATCLRDSPFPPLEAVRVHIPAARCVEPRQALPRVTMSNCYWACGAKQDPSPRQSVASGQDLLSGEGH